jgi:diguanylate cyclase (GGDEF)-like protein
MSDYPFFIAKASLVFLAIFLVVEYAGRRRQLSRDTVKNQQMQQHLAAYATELKNLNRQLARKNEIAEKLPLFTKKMTERLSQDAYPPIAVRFAKEFFHADKIGYLGSIGVDSEYTLVVGAGLPNDWMGKVRINAEDGILGLVLKKKVVISRIDPDAVGRRTSGLSLEARGLAPDFVAPIFGVSGLVGFLVIAGCSIPISEEKAHVSMVADLLSTMLQKAALLDSERNSAWVDHLTGVATRFYFLQRFESEIRRTENYRQHMALFLFDIDEFKEINDTHGHHAGDIVLMKMAALVKLNTRSSDLVGRYGGDEFLVLITSTDADHVISYAEKLREKIAAADIEIPGSEKPVRISISGGLAVFPTNGQSTTELLKAADDALYEAKRQGRNRIMVAASPGIGGGTDTEAGTVQGFRKEEPEEAEPGILEYALGETGEKLGN